MGKYDYFADQLGDFNGTVGFEVGDYDAGRTLVIDPLRLVIVRDMWLTGFDAPSMHTMYIDKPMRGHGLMQAIARVNRTADNKDYGLIIDYWGVSEALQEALAVFSPSDIQALSSAAPTTCISPAPAPRCEGRCPSTR